MAEVATVSLSASASLVKAQALVRQNSRPEVAAAGGIIDATAWPVSIGAGLLLPSHKKSGQPGQAQ